MIRSTFAVDGAKFKVNQEVEKTIQSFHAASKPIGSVTVVITVVNWLTASARARTILSSTLVSFNALRRMTFIHHYLVFEVA